MPMEWEREKIIGKQQGANQTSQILLEGDIIVPDSKPDVTNVLRTDGTVKIKNVVVGDGAVNISGELDLCILYTSDQGEKALYGMTASLPIEEVVHIEGLEKGMQVNVRDNLEYLDSQVVNDRKIAAKAIIELITSVSSTQEVEAIMPADMPEFAYLEETIQMNELVADKKDTFTVREAVTLPSSYPPIGEILCSNVYFVEQDARAMDGKVAMRGNLVLDVLYSDDTEMGTPHAYYTKVPFQWQMDVDGVTPKSTIDTQMVLQEMSVTPALDDDGEPRIFNIAGDVAAEVRAWEDVERTIITDAYVPGQPTDVTTQTLHYPDSVEYLRNEFNIRERVTLNADESPILQVEKVWGRVSIEDVVVGDGYIDVEGVLSVEILYFCENDQQAVCVARKGIPFEQRIEERSVDAQDALLVTSNIESLDFESLSPTEGEVYATILINLGAEHEGLAEVVTDVQLSDRTAIEETPMANIIIYRVQPGDTLWTIAKEFDTTVERIIRVNELDSPELIYPDQKLLIVKSRR